MIISSIAVINSSTKHTLGKQTSIQTSLQTVKNHTSLVAYQVHIIFLSFLDHKPKPVMTFPLSVKYSGSQIFSCIRNLTFLLTATTDLTVGSIQHS